jgi:hypothetical protein
MAAAIQKSLTEEILINIFNATSFAVSFLALKLWRFLKYGLFKIKDRRIIYGKINGKAIFDYPKGRNQQTYIKGKPGFGKSALAANLALQNIEQGTAGIFIDPHGNPQATKKDKKGAVVEIFQRAKDVSNVVFLTVNQQHKVIGYNPLFLIGSLDELEDLKDYLMNTIFYNSVNSINEGQEVADAAELILDTVVHFHNAYSDWLLQIKNKTPQKAKSILQTRQITINDLANLTHNPHLIDLFIEILGFEQSRYYRPDLVNRWSEVKDKDTFESGLKGATKRLKKMVTTSKSKYFFESYGFNLLEERRKGKFILCDISGLDNFTKAMLSKLVLVKFYTLHDKDELHDQTEMYIDEASNVELPNTSNIISEGRKMEFALTLIFQFSKQFENPKTINAIGHAVVNKINFRNEESDFNAPLDKTANLKKREFILENSRGVFENVRTLYMPPIRRKVRFEERGVSKEELRAGIIAKQTDPLGYFKNV